MVSLYDGVRRPSLTNKANHTVTEGALRKHVSDVPTPKTGVSQHRSLRESNHPLRQVTRNVSATGVPNFLAPLSLHFKVLVFLMYVVVRPWVCLLAQGLSS